MTRDLSRARAIGYIRVSTERQAGDSVTSLADQRRAIESLAAKLGRTVDEWFTDEGASGASVEGRPAFCDLRDSCEAYPRAKESSDLVLVLNDSRFGRFPNPEESTYWRFHLERLGWHVRFAEGDDVENVMGRVVLRSIGAAQASQYREAIVANARRGAKGTAELGYWGREAPFGFRRRVVYPQGRERVLDRGALKAPDEKVALIPEEAVEAPLVREIFARYAAGGQSLGSLAAWLAKTLPDRIVWSRTTVQMVLKNPAYAGDIVGGRRQRDGQTYGRRDAHPPIVTRTLFAEVQDRLASNRRSVRGAPGKYVLSGLIECPYCHAAYVGGGLGGSHRKTKLWFYKCSSGANEPPHRHACPGRVGTISKTKLEGAVIGAIARELSRPGSARAIEREIDRVLSQRPATLAADLERTRKDRTAAERRRDRLVTSIAEGTLTSAEAGPQLTVVREELARLSDRDTSMRFEAAGATIDPRARASIVGLAMDFPSVAKRLDGLALRELVRPWLASASFDKVSRVLTLGIRRIPATGPLMMTSQPGPVGHQKRSAGVVVREVDLSPSGEAARRRAAAGR